jgi:hypothetical protein
MPHTRNAHTPDQPARLLSPRHMTLFTEGKISKERLFLAASLVGKSDMAALLTKRHD